MESVEPRQAVEHAWSTSESRAGLHSWHDAVQDLCQLHLSASRMGAPKAPHGGNFKLRGNRCIDVMCWGSRARC